MNHKQNNKKPGTSKLTIVRKKTTPVIEDKPSNTPTNSNTNVTKHGITVLKDKPTFDPGRPFHTPKQDTVKTEEKPKGYLGKNFDPNKSKGGNKTPFIKNSNSGDKKPFTTKRTPVTYNVNSLPEGLTKENCKIKIPVKGDLPNIDYVNLVKFSDSELGKALSPSTVVSLQTVFGKVGTIRQLMDYLVIIDYPIQFLSKTTLNRSDIDKIPKKRRAVVNYWGIISMILIQRIRDDHKVLEKLISLPKTVKFTSFDTSKTVDGLGDTIIVHKPNTELHRYCLIINDIYRAVKEDRFALQNKDKCIEIINKNTYDKTVGLYEGLSFVNKELQ